VDIAKNIEEVPASCNLIVTTTPSKAPLLSAKDIRPGTHITAMGSDADGKQELDPEILEKATTVACDSISQCVDHGEVYHAIKAGVLNANDLIEVGQIISNPIERNEDAITVADLTGIATQDIKITAMVLENQP
jgi:ornithine cyclodeaminase